MNTYQIPGFDTIDLNDLNDYYDAQIKFKEREIALDINFDEYSTDRQKLEAISSVVNHLADYDEKARKAMEEDYLSGDTIKTYIENHQDLFGENEVAEQIAKLYLKRVGFYPENEEGFAVFDYTISEQETQYLVVINFKKDGGIDSLTMES